MQDTSLDDVTRWWWIRHAPVVGHAGRIYGSNDVPADTDDPESYANLAQRLPTDAVWVTSHLSRTHVTADAIADAGLAHDERAVERGLGEQNFGDWQGMTYDELDELWRNDQSEEARHKFWYAPAAHTPPNGESFVEVIARVSEVILRLTEVHRGRDIVAVAHGGVIRAAVALALDLDPERALGMQTENLSTTRLDHIAGPGLGGNWRVAFVNLRAK
jgi:broad specificity phosphatase PhoE